MNMYIYMVTFHTGTAIQFTPRFDIHKMCQLRELCGLPCCYPPPPLPVVSGCSLSQPEWIIHIVNPDHQMHAIWV